MSLDLQSIHFVSRQQNPGRVPLKFWPAVAVGSDDETLLSEDWVFLSEDDGTLTFSLPVKSTGTIRWNYLLPAQPGRLSQGYFDLAKTSGTIEFDELVGPGASPATDSVKDYVDQKTAGIPKIYLANNISQSGTGAPHSNILGKDDFADVVFARTNPGQYTATSPQFGTKSGGVAQILPFQNNLEFIGVVQPTGDPTVLAIFVYASDGNPTDNWSGSLELFDYGS